MKKCDLKNGMLVETADGEVYRVLDGFLRNTYKTINISCFDRDLFNRTTGSEIVRVFEGDDFLHLDTKGKALIWERTEDPITVLRKAIDNIKEEMADVTIMLDQLKIMFDNEDTVGKIKSEKIQRLKQRLEE